MKAQADTQLRGRFLLAMPGMGDPRFERSVIYLFAHDDEGSMGFIVNHPTEGLTLGEIATNLPDTVANTGLANLPVFVGGPVQPESGFVLFTEDEEAAEETPAIGVTQSLDILIKAAKGRGPAHMRLVLGYAGWGPGQLENEIQDNAWLICPGDEADIFSPEPQALYARMVERLGIDLAMLSQSGGEA
jgi:putative transcriptional regulator